MVNYYHKFIPNSSAILKPLFNLLQKNVAFKIDEDCLNSFNQIKNILASTEVLVHFDHKLPIQLSVDASLYGVGAVITHNLNGVDRPIAYASRTLSKSEEKYSQIEKEALAIVFGVSKFYQYLFAKKFILLTDHKPLVTIFGPKKGIPIFAANRLQRWALILANFQFEIKYVRSENNYSDWLSRLPLSETSENEENLSFLINYIADNENVPLNWQNIQNCSLKDPILTKVYQYVKIGWPKKVESELKPYYVNRNSLTIVDNCLMFGYRVIVPLMLQGEILKEIHKSHMGMVKMKSLARSYVWWPGINLDIEKTVRACDACIKYRNNPEKAELINWEYPSNCWERIHIDHLGPIFGKHIFVVIDAYSKWPEAFIVNSTNSFTTIKILRSLFARYGFPQQIISDNATSFVSAEFTNFLKLNGVNIVHSPPFHPATNGQAENSVKSIKLSLLKSVESGNFNLDLMLNRFLMDYRNTPHCTTGVSPSILMIGRKLRTRLDLLLPQNSKKNNIPEKVKNNLFKQKKYYKGKRDKMFERGEIVLVKDYRGLKTKWIKGTVRKKIGPRA